MLGIYQNHNLTDNELRTLVFKGELIINSSNSATKNLCDYAKKMIYESFAPFDPETAQENLALPEFVSIVSELKTKFTNHDHTKKLVKELLTDLKFDLDNTYFDVPRLRVVSYNNYLSAGVGYAYKPHRDIWYSAPTVQINYWMPVFDICAENGMALYPDYWKTPIINSSKNFDYDEWKAVGRQQAINTIDNDLRNHPLSLENKEFKGLCIAGCSGDLLVFSASHLHGTIPNMTKKIRFSIDFRTINLQDLEQNLGAINIDSEAKGTTLGDYISAKDFSPIENKYITKYFQRVNESVSA